LRSERLLFRHPQPTDAAAIADLLGNDPEGVRMTARIPEPCTEAAARAWLATVAEEPWTWAILRREDQAFVGMIGFSGPSERMELGFWIGRPFRRLSYATEAVHWAIDQARRLGGKTLVGDVFPHNAASIRIVEKLGFQRTGTAVKDFPVRGGPREVLQYQLTL